MDFNFREGYKIYTIPPVQIPDKVPFPSDVELDFATEKRKLFLPNQNIFEKLYSLDGYSSMAIANYLNLFSDSSKTITGLGNLNIKDVDFSKHGVKYIISKEKIDYLKNLKYISNIYFIYEIENAKSRYYLEKNGSVELVTQNPIEIIFKTTTNKTNNRLIFLDNSYPGWEVYIDGVKNKIQVFENVYKSVLVPSGNHLVRFKFLPISYKIGKIISITSFLFVLFILIRKSNIEDFS